MNEQRFDALTRRLSRSRSRRAVVKGLIAGITGGLIGASTGGVALARAPRSSAPGTDDRSLITRWILCNVEHAHDPIWAFCDEQCVYLETSHDNCGACGNECASCEQCVDGACIADCPSSDACTVGTCNHDADRCVYQQIICDDGNVCTVDTCDVRLGCVHTLIDCDDGDPCTIDSCDPELGCIHMPVDCGVLQCQNGVCV